MEWIELTLRPNSDDKKTPRKVMQRIDQIGDIYIDPYGYTCISPLYMKGEDYKVMEPYEEVQQILSAREEQIFTVPTQQEKNEELTLLRNWMKEHGYEMD